MNPTGGKRELAVKILGVSGSPRKSATYYSIKTALDAASEISDVNVDLIDLRGKTINFCIHCNACRRKNVLYCPTFNDDMNSFYEKLVEADGFIMASPVYQMNITAQLQAFFNRWRPLGGLAKEAHWSFKVGGGIAVGGRRNGGQETALEAINNFFLCQGMVVAGGGVFAYNGGTVWSNDMGQEGAKNDSVGMDTVKVMGRRVAVIAKVLKANSELIGQEISKGQRVGFSSDEELIEQFSAFRNRHPSGK